MPRRPSAIAAVMSRSLSSMARSLGTARLTPPGEPARRLLNRGPEPAVDDREDARPPRCTGAGATGRSGGQASGGRPMKSKRVQAMVLATAAVAGYGGAAAFSALAD